MMIKKLLTLITVLMLGQFTNGQQRSLEKANQKYEEYSFRPAIDIYKKVLDKGY